MKNIKQTAAKLQQYGRNGDTMLAHITPEEASLLKRLGGSGTINPKTGLPEYFLGGVVSGIVGGIGGLLTGGAASRAADTAAASYRDAANRATQMAMFRPIGITTGFGSSQFDVNDLGQVTSAGYELTPELAGLRNNLITGATTFDPTALAALTTPALASSVQSLFNLGQGYLAETPQQAAERFVSQQQALLAPQRAAQLSGVRGRLFGTGRGGLGVQTGTGSAPASPELQAYYNALARQDMELAARGQQAGMEQARFGTGLITGASELARQIPALQAAGYLPIEAQLGLARTIESMGQQPFNLSLGLAEAQSGAGRGAGSAYLTGMTPAIAAQQRADSYSPLGSFLSGGGGGALSGLFSGGFGSLFGGSSPVPIPGTAAAFTRGGSEGSLTWRD